MQAILTKIIPATNTLPTRIGAGCARGRIMFSTTHLTVENGSDEAHRMAAKSLCDKFCAEDVKQYGSTRNPWAGEFVTGTLPNGDHCHVFTKIMTTQQMKAIGSLQERHDRLLRENEALREVLKAIAPKIGDMLGRLRFSIAGDADILPAIKAALAQVEGEAKQ